VSTHAVQPNPWRDNRHWRELRVTFLIRGIGEDLLAVLTPSAEVERLASPERMILAAAGLYGRDVWRLPRSVRTRPAKC